uniref:Uncharacterized protein n=1 Tax=Pyrodinium bahamense TaxID=73915 RepID=A0A7S0FWP4_9DINO|mmetsp:Transcript_6113/g.16609  ORF Transcript_6113/g.16609 Transcript_6113/m.16609 type:complete len:131 (+) Transcript_6113:116-508(+)
MTDGKVSIGRVFDVKQVLLAYNQQNPQNPVDVEGMPTGPEWDVEDYFPRATAQQKIFYFDFRRGQEWSGTSPRMVIGFYNMLFRCGDGDNLALSELDHFLLSDAERDTLARAADALGLPVEGPLKVVVMS